MGIKAEWDMLREVAMHRPSIEMYFGLLDPYASLYERAFNMSKALEEHDLLKQKIKEFGIKVVTLEDEIISRADSDEETRKRLERLGIAAMHFTGDANEVAISRKRLLEDKKAYDSAFFLTSAIMHPVIRLEKAKEERKISIDISEKPSSNLYFMRDQQAVTDKGIVLARMAKPQRRNEPTITKFLWKTIGKKIAYEIKGNATFEGGDFMPMGDFALIGMGDRTNAEGIRQLMHNGISFDEVGVVHQPMHPLVPSSKPDPMIDMHLDTYFNAASSSTVVGSDVLLKNATVEVYTKQGKGEYKKEKGQFTLYDYIKSKGFNVVELTTLGQLSYASNFLTIKDGTIIAIDISRIARKVIRDLSFKARVNIKRYGRLLAQAKKDYRKLEEEGFFPNSKGIKENGIEVCPIDLTNLTGGYGGAHCMTAALERG